MLRNPPTRLPLGMADVNQTKQRLKLKQTSNPLVAHSITLRQGPERSRDAAVVQLGPNRHVPHFAIFDSTGEDGDSSDHVSTSLESVADRVHIPEVSPTIIQAPGYDLPALVGESLSDPITRGRHSSATPGTYHQQAFDSSHLQQELDPSHRHNEVINTGPDILHYSISTPNQITVRDPGLAALSRRGHNPAATSFAPRVHFGSAVQELSNHRSTLPSVYRRGGNLRIRSSSSRNSLVGRSDMSHHARPRPMPNHRPSIRGTRRLRGYIGPPTNMSTTSVMDRYPVFPSTQVQHEPSRIGQPHLPRPLSIPQRRGISVPPSEIRTIRSLYPQSRFSSTTDIHLSARSRASWNEFSPVRETSVQSSRMGSRTSSFAAPAQSASTGGQSEQLLLLQQSPLDRLMQDFQRLSTELSTRPQSHTSRATSTDGRLLSTESCYSNSDDDTQDQELTLWDGSSQFGSSYGDDGHSMGRRTDEPSYQRQRYMGIAARIADVEADFESGSIELPSSSQSRQSSSSLAGIGSMTSSSFSAEDVAVLSLSTPERQARASTRTPFTSRSSMHAQATPRVRVYDDGQPAGTQPQTPADVGRRGRLPVNPLSLMSGSCRTVRVPARVSSSNQAASILHPDTHRSPNPSLPHPMVLAHAASLSPASPYSPNFDLRTAAAVSAVARRRTGRGTFNENEFDPSTLGLEAEREALVGRREQGDSNTMDYTPPREGRFEQYYD